MHVVGRHILATKVGIYRRLFSFLALSLSCLVIGFPLFNTPTILHSYSEDSSFSINNKPPLPFNINSSNTTSNQTSICVFNTCYYYVGAAEYKIKASGAQASFTQADQTLSPNDSHTLTEIAVESTKASQIVELGWTVDPSINGDSLPHLFVFHWVNGTCWRNYYRWHSR